MCCGRKRSSFRRGTSGRINRNRFKTPQAPKDVNTPENSERLQSTDHDERQDQARTMEPPEIQGS
jgi:hypothetical protein